MSSTTRNIVNEETLGRWREADAPARATVLHAIGDFAKRADRNGDIAAGNTARDALMLLADLARAAAEPEAKACACYFCTTRWDGPHAYLDERDACGAWLGDSGQVRCNKPVGHWRGAP